MDKTIVRRFQGTLAAANMPANAATSEAILILADKTLKGEKLTVDAINVEVDTINQRYAIEAQKAEAAKQQSPSPLRKS